MLDSDAQKYALLLRDPCNAPLTHPIYPGGGSGFLFRAESFFSAGTTATHTAGILHWTPGYPNTDATELLVGSSVADGAAVAMGANTNNPGRGFLAANARGARCIAACLKVTYAGAESTRAGRVHYGHTLAGTIDKDESHHTTSVVQLLQNYTRTPVDAIEVLWKPDIGDAEFTDPTSHAGHLIRDRRSSITVAWAGLPPGVGLVFHLTAVYEWTPASGIGLGSNFNGKATSRNTLDDVIDFVGRGFRWVRDNMGPDTTRMVFGMIPTIARARQMRNLAY